MTKGTNIIDDLVAEFSNIVQYEFNPAKEYKLEAIRLYDACKEHILPFDDRKNACIFAINRKFDLNKAGIKDFIDYAAKHGIIFNYHEKKEIFNFYDANNVDLFKSWLQLKLTNKSSFQSYFAHFNPISEADTIKNLHQLIQTTGKGHDILHALFAAYIFNSFNVKSVHEYFSGEGQEDTKYVSNFFDYLQTYPGNNLHRDKALTVISINDNNFGKFNDNGTLRDSVCHQISEAYKTLSNHCYLAIHIDIPGQNKALKWDLFADFVLYAEKFIEEDLKLGYFHPEKIEESTSSYIKELDKEAAEFKIANGGFTYKDCFILTANEISPRAAKELTDDYALLILFEKNERDETIVPCPACRSTNVRGNSYPIIGVKSWECNNLLCPEKSKFNRGKRYSLASLVKQEAIFNESNQIKNGTIKKWRLDVLQKVEFEGIIEFLIKHYTLVDDNVEIIGYNLPDLEAYGRKITYANLNERQDGILKNFYSFPYFKRFIIENKFEAVDKKINISTVPGHEIYQGDSKEVLDCFPDNHIDAAVTSPPYYNAREYSQWDNIYCYLYDMFNNAIAVNKKLKPGALYLYNIFDYFDNEKNIVFSAMGKKRMILGAYIIHMFKIAGFEFVKNIIWYKGHIQGNRSFNQGNMFPYYQAPLNCYEHILAFRKPGENCDEIDLPDVINVKPVHKMVKGENILGHTAPFPMDLPRLLVKNMSPSQKILDPYAGSFTTARAAQECNVKSVCIELSKEYCELGLRLLSK